MSSSSQAQYWLGGDIDFQYHVRQYEQCYRSTAHFGNFMASCLGDVTRDYRILDVGCGAGANLYHLARLFPGASWVGVDISPRLIELGKQLLAERLPQTTVQLEVGDFYQLDARFEAGAFDLVLSMQTLSWLPEYEQAVAQLLRLVKPGGYVFVSSLFTDFLVDARIEVRQYPDGNFERATDPTFYNVYALARFKEVCKRLGAKEVQAVDFQIDVDLPKPSHGKMGTYTVKMPDEQRLQVSGPLLMPWKFLAIQA